MKNLSYHDLSTRLEGEDLFSTKPQISDTLKKFIAELYPTKSRYEL